MKNTQRGALFGIDARIAMAILGALALISGSTMHLMIPEIKAKNLIKGIEVYKASVEGMQYDLKRDIPSVITATGDLQIKSFQALNDVTQIQVPFRVNWLGPYLKSQQSDASVHKDYGQMHLIRAEQNDFTDLVCTSCFYWLQIDNVPQEAFSIVNDNSDGVGEGAPTTQGRARWVANTLYVRLGRSL